MKKIEAIIRPHKLDEVRQALGDKIHGMSVSEIKGFGRQRGHSEVYRGQEYRIDFVPKLRVDIVCEADEVDGIVDTILKAARSGKVGDGKIFIHDLDRVIRIRTGESGVEAI